ncbi:hypothetical protein LEMLEM_LOCUS1988 [Lemmus lemmus]
MVLELLCRGPKEKGHFQSHSPLHHMLQQSHYSRRHMGLPLHLPWPQKRAGVLWFWLDLESQLLLISILETSYSTRTTSYWEIMKLLIWKWILIRKMVLPLADWQKSLVLLLGEKING